MKHYDVIVIGSGGGSKITRPAAALGNKVAIIEKDSLGGTCLNHGCIPSKMLIHPADVCAEILEAKRFNITTDENYTPDFKTLIERVTATITKDSDSIEPAYERIENIDLYKGTASFVSNNVLEVNGEQITAPKIFISAGARASIPSIKGLDGTPYITYKEALRQTTQPKKMIIVGGGFIAVELGYFYAMMGTEVHFLVREKLMRPLDNDVIEEFTGSLQDKVKIHCEPNILRVHHDGSEFTVMTDNEIYQADSLFMATGMQPNTDLLKCKENTDIELDERGFIKVNDHFETSVPGVYAFGDILGRYMFRHTANYEGEYVFNHVFGDQKEPIKYPPVPYAVFSNPQIGGVGESEKSLQAKGIDYIVGKNNYRNSAMGMALLSEEGFCKLLFDKQTKKLLGAHIVGKEASNMVHMCIAYIKMGGTLDDVMDTIYIHPALPEIVRNAGRKAAAEFAKG